MKFSELQSKYKSLIGFLVKAYSMGSPEDLRQELLSSLYLFDKMEENAAWIPLALKRVAYRYIRKNKKYSDIEEFPESYDVPYEETMEDFCCCMKFANKINQLKDRGIINAQEYSFIELFYYRSMDYPCISKILGIEIKSAYKLNRRVLDKLRPHFRSWV